MERSDKRDCKKLPLKARYPPAISRQDDDGSKGLNYGESIHRGVMGTGGSGGFAMESEAGPYA